MKRRNILCLILAMLMLFSTMLCACADKKNTQTPTKGQGTTTNPPVNNNNPTTQPDSKPSDNQGDDENLSLGYFEGNDYINPYIGVVCKLSEKWTHKSADELQDVGSTVLDKLSGSALGSFLEDYMDEGAQLIAMSAENVTDLTVINAVYVRMTDSEYEQVQSMTQDEVINGVLSMKDLLIEGYKMNGINVNSMEKATVKFLGADCPAILTVSTISGVPYYTLQLVFQHAGRYAVTVTLASFQTNRTSELLELFSKI